MINSAAGHAVGLLASARRTRAFHPKGVTCTGYATIGDQTLPLRSGASTLRLSKGLGTPGSLPDIIGVAARLPAPGARSEDRWDVLMSGQLRYAGPLPFVLPARCWSQVQLTTLNRFDYRGTRWVITGQLLIPAARTGLSTDGLRAAIGSRGGALALSASADHARSRPIGLVNFSLDRRDDIAFDPIDGTPDEVRPVPGWLAGLRRSAYAASRRARGA